MAGKLDYRWHEARAAANRGDLGAALFLYRSLADDGDELALVEVGNLLEIGGNGVTRDLEEAAKWYRRSVFQCDDPKAHLALTRLLFNKALKEEVAREAFETHARRALEKDEPAAALMWAIALDDGRFGVRNVAKASTYYRIAAAAGYLFARKRLAALKLHSGNIVGGLRDLFVVTRDIFRVHRKDPANPLLAGLLKEDRISG